MHEKAPGAMLAFCVQVLPRNYVCGVQQGDGSVAGNGKFKMRGNEGENNMGILS